MKLIQSNTPEKEFHCVNPKHQQPLRRGPTTALEERFSAQRTGGLIAGCEPFVLQKEERKKKKKKESV